MTVAAGVLIWLVNPDAYPNVGQGLWWALLTVTTGTISAAFIETARKRLGVSDTQAMQAEVGALREEIRSRADS